MLGQPCERRAAAYADVRLRLLRDEAQYESWLHAATGWASGLGTTIDRVELLVFSDGLREGSAWMPDAE